MLEELLIKLDLDTKERLIYKSIVESGKIVTARLAQVTGINRTTVYSVCGELKKKGLIKETIGEKVTYWTARESSELDRIVTKDQEQLAQKALLINKLKDVLQQTPNPKKIFLPKIRFIEEDEIDSYLHEASPKWNTSCLEKDTTWWGFQDYSFVERYEKWILWYWKNAPQEIDLKLFSNDSTIEAHMSGQKLDRRQIRFWDGVNDFTGTLWITGDFITMIQTSQKPFYLVEINDAVLAHNMREVFRKLWE